MNAEELVAQITAAEGDEEGRAARQELCEVLAECLAFTGQALWMTGALIGPDRVEATSPFGYGSDATVGLATAVEVGGQLVTGAVQLLQREHLYSAACLVRQLVEIEYLTWAFAEDEDEALTWMRSSAEERLKMWQPRHLRERAGDRFRGKDYALHCEYGGHPTPSSRHLLPGHPNRRPIGLMWFDLACHATSVWRYTLTAAGSRRAEALSNNVALAAVAPAIERWHACDPLHPLMKLDVPQWT